MSRDNEKFIVTLFEDNKVYCVGVTANDDMKILNVIPLGGNYDSIKFDFLSKIIATEEYGSRHIVSYNGNDYNVYLSLESFSYVTAVVVIKI